jgi:hypothetical protein
MRARNFSRNAQPEAVSASLFAVRAIAAVKALEHFLARGGRND